MSAVVDIIGAVTAAGGIGAITSLLTIRSTNRKLTAQTESMSAQAKKTKAEEIDILTGAATDLVAPLRATLAETRAELAATKIQAGELTAEVEHLRLVVNETTAKLDAANLRADQATRRAEFYKDAFDQRAGN